MSEQVQHNSASQCLRHSGGEPAPGLIRGRNPLSSGWIYNDPGPPGSVPCDGPAP